MSQAETSQVRRLLPVLSKRARQQNIASVHFIGSSIRLMLVAAALPLRLWWLVPVVLLQGYLLAWIGHFFVEHNRPSTFAYPRYSFRGDWRLWWDILIGKICL